MEPAKVGRVRKFFLESGALSAEVSPFNDCISVRMRADDASRALRTTISTFSHRERLDVGSIHRASATYSLPASVAADVTLVGELLQFPSLRAPVEFTELVEEESNTETIVGKGGDWPNACEAAGCKGLVTPAVLHQRYNIDATIGATRGDALSSMAVAEFQGQHFKPSDLVKFSSSCHVNVTVDKEVGGDSPPTPGVEAELDIEYIKAVAPHIPLTVVYVAGKYSLLGWANTVTGLSDPPLVHSVSYGNDEKQQSGVAYMDSVNLAFMKAGARGLSILFASGDQGVCGREGCRIIFKKFHPDFPGGSPYQTSVGGTDFVTASIGEEMAWGSSGGGFSNTFGIPDYQASAVAAFKSNSSALGLLPPQRMWNNTGRGYPDVSALGGQKAPYCVSVQGRFAGVAGTSASTPVFGGIVAKLNGLRLAAGKRPLGFLNPLLYMHPHAFNDVTKGKNSETAFNKYGFTAIAGWDAATGLGTPNYEALAKIVV